MSENGTHIKDLFGEKCQTQGWFGIDDILERERDIAFRFNNGSRYARDPHDMEILEEIK